MDQTEGKVHKLPKKIKTNIFPIWNKQASSIKDLLLSMALYKFVNSKALLVRARYKDERREQTIFIMSFLQKFFPKIIGKKARTNFRLHTKLSS